VKHLPQVYGGPAAGQGSQLGRGGLPSGALFGFSGIDGQTNTLAQYVGWFMDGSYSVWLWTPTPRILSLGFGANVTADPLLDKIVVATNDVLLVERGASKLMVTWRDWRTIVGFVTGEDATALLQEHKPNCGALKEYPFPRPSTAQQWQWKIEASYDGYGPTICNIALQIGGAWLTNASWRVEALYHPNGPVQNLLSKGCESFWNADTGKSGPWFLNLDLGEAQEVTGFQYSIYQATEAPKKFEVLVRRGPVYEIALETNATNHGCSDYQSVNVSRSSKDVLAFHREASSPGAYTFALCYASPDNEKQAVECAAEAARDDVARIMEERNEYIASLSALKEPTDDRFQRKLLSVMKD